MDPQEKAIDQWFRSNGYLVVLEIGTINVSSDPEKPDNRANHQEKYAVVSKVVQGAEPQLLYKIKMDPDDTVLDSFRRVKEFLEKEGSKNKIDIQEALSKHVIPRLRFCTCPVCKSIEWRISDSIFEFSGFSKQINIGEVVPVVLATCHICGFILPFNAIHVGAVDSKGEVRL